MSNLGTWLSDLFSKILNWLKGAEKTLHPLIMIAEDLLNGLKAFDASALGQTVEGIIEAAIPASTGLINAVKLQLPIWLKELKWLDDITGKSLTEIWTESQQYLNSIEDPNVRAAQLNTLKALFTNFFVQNSNEAISPTTPFTIQHALLLSTPTHNPAIVDEV